MNNGKARRSAAILSKELRIAFLCLLYRVSSASEWVREEEKNMSKQISVFLLFVLCVFIFSDASKTVATAKLFPRCNFFPLSLSLLFFFFLCLQLYYLPLVMNVVHILSLSSSYFFFIIIILISGLENWFAMSNFSLCIWYPFHPRYRLSHGERLNSAGIWFALKVH